MGYSARVTAWYNLNTALNYIHMHIMNPHRYTLQHTVLTLFHNNLVMDKDLRVEASCIWLIYHYQLCLAQESRIIVLSTQL